MLAAGAAGLTSLPSANAFPSPEPQSEGVRHNALSVFERHGVSGTYVVADERSGKNNLWASDADRISAQYSPASTFKIPHALFALDAGVVKDEFQVFPWDGVERSIPTWNQDQTLRTSMQHSTVWLYQQWAREIGRKRETAYLYASDYGNREIGDAVDAFWLDGSLQISAMAQVNFLRRLYRNELPFNVAHQRLVKDIMLNEATYTARLRAKTGWALRDGMDLGWWVGWVELPDGPVFFACNIDMDGGQHAPKRKEVVQDVLRDIDAWPFCPPFPTQWSVPTFGVRRRLPRS